MGDGADMALEAIWDYDEYMMREHDPAMEIPFDGPYTYYEPVRNVIRPTPVIKVITPTKSVVKSNTITCKRCGQDGFTWGKTDAGYWWLKDSSGKFHKCEKK